MCIVSDLNTSDGGAGGICTKGDMETSPANTPSFSVFYVFKVVLIDFGVSESATSQQAEVKTPTVFHRRQGGQSESIRKPAQNWRFEFEVS